LKDLDGREQEEGSSDAYKPDSDADQGKVAADPDQEQDAGENHGDADVPVTGAAWCWPWA